MNLSILSKEYEPITDCVSSTTGLAISLENWFSSCPWKTIDVEGKMSPGPLEAPGFR